MSFIGIVAYTLADKLLANSKYSLTSAFNLLRNLKISVFDKNAVVQELTKKMKEVIKPFGVTIPQSIPCGEKKPGIKAYFFVCIFLHFSLLTLPPNVPSALLQQPNLFKKF